MKYVRRVVLLTLTAAFVFVLSACGKQTLETASVTDPTHFYEEVREGFLIDAEVCGMPENCIPKIYEGHRKIFTHEEIADFLAFLGDASVKTEQMPHPYYDHLADYYFVGTCSSGNKFVQFGCVEEHLSTGFEYVNDAGYIYYNSYPIYFGQSDYDENAHGRLAYLFMEPKNFAFATAQQAEQSVRDALSKLGLGELLLNRILYLDHQAMDEAGEILKAPEWASLKGDGYPTKEDWSENDDGYMFEFFYTIQGLPLCDESIEMDTVGYLGGSIQVWYQANKIVHLKIDNPWTAGNVISEPDQIIPAEAALTLARDKLNAILIYQDMVINRISLEYIYVQNKDSWILTPVWIVSAQYRSQWIPEATITEHVVVDAITGCEI